MKINDTLHNGAKVLAFNEWGRIGVVLAKRGIDQFVVWNYYDSNSRSTSQGSYFDIDNFTGAIAEYQRRVSENMKFVGDLPK